MSLLSLGGSQTLVIEQARSYAVEFDCYDDDAGTTPTFLAGYTAKAQIRPWPGASTVIAEFTTSVDSGGSVTISLSATQTATIRKSAVYDVELTPPGQDPLGLVHGPIVVVPAVTR